MCQSVGEAVPRLVSVPLPGPVIGLLLLWLLAGRDGRRGLKAL